MYLVSAIEQTRGFHPRSIYFLFVLCLIASINSSVLLNMTQSSSRKRQVLYGTMALLFFFLLEAAETVAPHKVTNQLFALSNLFSKGPLQYCTQFNFKRIEHNCWRCLLNKHHFISNCPNTPNPLQRALNTEIFMSDPEKPANPSRDRLAIQGVTVYQGC